MENTETKYAIYQVLTAKAAKMAVGQEMRHGGQYDLARATSEAARLNARAQAAGKTGEGISYVVRAL